MPNENAAPNARPYTFVVNSKRIFIKGWNWVPLDVMYGVERPEKLEHLLRLAQRADVTLLRVWGGGLIEKEAFYELADRYGILIWQEFILSSSGIDNNPSDSPECIELLVREAEQIIPRKRNHPSLALWCGGNELTTLSVEKVVREDSWTLTISNTGDHAVVYLWLEDSRNVSVPGFAEFSDNHFCLLPQETQQIVVSWVGVSPETRNIGISHWNGA